MQKWNCWEFAKVQSIIDSEFAFLTERLQVSEWISNNSEEALKTNE
jgi:hypothetical protein